MSGSALAAMLAGSSAAAHEPLFARVTAWLWVPAGPSTEKRKAMATATAAAVGSARRVGKRFGCGDSVVASSHAIGSAAANIADGKFMYRSRSWWAAK